jgi:hypothetical protein
LSEQAPTASGTILRGGGLLLLWSSMAWAGVTEEEAAQEVQRIQVELGEPVLVGALGPEAERAFSRQARMNGNMAVEVVRIPTAGDRDRELQTALQRTGLRCGVVFSAEGAGWALEPFGDCTPLPPEERAVRQATEEATQPIAVVITDASIPDNVAAYNRKAITLRTERSGEWDVLAGARSRPLSAPAFAALIQDAPTEQTLADEKKRAMTATKAFRLGGAAVVATGLIPFIGMPSITTPAGEDRVWTALFLGGTGLMAMIVAPRAIEGISASQTHLDGYYTADEAEEHIETYNRALKVELGLETPEPEADDEEAAELLFEPELDAITPQPPEVIVPPETDGEDAP